MLGFKGQPEVRAGNAPITVGTTNAELRELEGVGVVASAYEPIEPKFNQFKAPVPGHYIVTVAPGHDPQGPARRAGARADHVYHAAFNGFAAALSKGQLERLRADPDVASVEQDSTGGIATTQARRQRRPVGAGSHRPASAPALEDLRVREQPGRRE